MFQLWHEIQHDILCLKKPVIIKFHHKKHELWEAYYQPQFDKWGEVKYHKIVVFNNSEAERSRSIHSIVAHELIHAFHAEQDTAEMHGTDFQFWARLIERKTKLERVYDVLLDEDAT